MKKFLLVIIIGIGVSLSTTFAMEHSYSDVKIQHKDDKNAVVSFTFHNETDRYYSDLYYLPKLSKYYFDELFSFLNDYTYFEPVKFSIGANESKVLTYDCVFPQNLPNGEYALSIDFYEKDKKISDTSLVAILEDVETPLEGKIYLEDLNSYCILVDDVAFDPISGPTVHKNSKVQAKISVKLIADENKTIIPRIKQYNRNALGELLLDTYGTSVELQPNEEKDIVIDIPVANDSESYLTQIILINENYQQVSQMYEFRYVLEGASANVSYINFGADNVLVAGVVGTADGSTLEDCEIICNIYDDENQLLETYSEPLPLMSYELEFDWLLTENTLKKDRFWVEIILKNEGVELTRRKNEIILNNIDGKEAIFSDLVGTKYEEAVIMLNGLGIVDGYPDGTFRPNNLITRAEFTVIADKIAKLALNEANSIFSDIDSHWAKNYIAVAAKNGFLSGYPDGTFRPNNSVTYAETATILVNMLGYKTSVNESKFEWPVNYMVKADELGLIGEIEVDNYNIPATRGDVAIMALNAYLML